ncbi:hypothetical protein BDV93DRAFT_271497 [Ceratobasidium sp. AG-I]|nr:hypothetical protein BDV93DRAFT_271497 [Ceratobasidium sp. AG-I]
MLAQDLAREIEAEMETDPSVGLSVEAEVEQEQAVLGADPLQTATSSNLEASQPVAEAESPAAEPLRRMDDETIPVTAHSKDTIIGILDDMIPAAAASEVQLKAPSEQGPPEAGPSGAAGIGGEVPAEDEVMQFEETEKILEDEIIPADAPEEQLPVKTVVYLEHIQMVEPSEDVQESGTVEEEVLADVDASSKDYAPGPEGELVPEQQNDSTSTVEVELVSLIDTQSTIENDPTLALGTDTQTQSHSTTTVETAVELAAQFGDPQLDSEAAPDTTVTTTTTTTTTIVTELDPAGQPASATDADADADAEAEVDQAEEVERINRAEQIRLEQTGNETEASGSTDKGATPLEEQLPLGEVAAGSPSPVVDSAAPQDSEMTSDAQPEGVQDVVLEPGPSTEAAALPEPEQVLSPRMPQYEIALTAPSVVAPPGLFDQPAGIDWEGFAALDEDAPGSPEFIDQSSEVPETPDEPIVAPLASTLNPATSDSAGPSKLASSSPEPPTPRARKPKMIMEVVLPLPNKPKPAMKQKAEETPRGRSSSKATTSARSGRSSTSKARSQSSEASPARSSRSSTTSATPSPRKNASTSSARASSASGSSRKRAPDARRRPFGSRKKVAKKPGQRHAQVDHVARALKVEVVMAKRPSVLRRTGSIPSGNSVKFAPSVSPKTGNKRKAEEQDVELDGGDQTAEEDEDADAEGEYEDVEEDEPEPEPELQPKASKSPSKPTKRARRSLTARKTPSKMPEVLTDTRRPKKRRIRR